MAGWYRVEFPDLENLDRALVELIVHPARRRGGLGTALLRHAADRAAAAGREVLSAEIQEGAPGEEFALRIGATLGIVEVRRVQDLAQIPADTSPGCTRRRRAPRPAIRSCAGPASLPKSGLTRWRRCTRR